MLDPFILEAINFQLPPEPPQMVQEQLWKSDDAKQAERLANRIVQSYRGYVDQWKDKTRKIWQTAERLPAGYLNGEAIRPLSQAIEDVERLAEMRARDLARLHKKLDREAKATFRLDPSAGAVAREFNRQTAAIDAELIDAYLEHALFLRALRAQVTPSEAGPIFDNADDLLKFLETA